MMVLEETSPIDFFPGTMPVEEWITEKPSKEEMEDAPDDFVIGRIIERAALFGLARDAYFKAAGVKNLHKLRGEPLVCINYDFSKDTQPDRFYWFLFKEDNNGTTYRVLHKDV